MWERTLQDLVRGLRANKKDESKFIAKAVDEIRQEIKTEDMELKAGAVLKLTYLDMLGYDMSWAAFHVVEVMSSSKVHLKTVGYLAAVQSFDRDTDVLMLTTNLLKKDLSSAPADTAVTLNGLSHIVTPELARDLSPELIAMLTHSRPHIRKRAILALYKLLQQYPEAIAHARQRLEERLEDSDPSVVAATVNVICELARKRPADYLSLAPQLFHLLTSSSNNWMLIKIVKLFGYLSPHEQRLVKKLQPPITELISTTPAISLLYECVHTCITGGMLQGSSGDSLAKLCVSKLATFIQDADQNLQYISLLAMTKIVPSHPHLIADYQDTIIASVNDQDISIRMRALDLVTAMANRSNLQSIIQQLLSHLVPEDSSSTLPTASQSLAQNATAAASTTSRSQVSPSQSPAYRLILSQRIINMCSQSMYEHITNFEWYLSVLVDLAYVANVDIGSQIRDQLVDVTGRVRAARGYAVKLMYSLLTDDNLVRNAGEPGNCTEILWAAAWICGEYCDELSDPRKLLPYLLDPRASTLPPDILSMYIQAALKIFGHWAAELAQTWTDERLREVRETVDTVLQRFGERRGHLYIEVQERAANAYQLFNFISADLNSYKPKPYSAPPVAGSSIPVEEGFASDPLRFPKSLYLIQPLFNSYELNPVASTAQASVPVPEGLDLDAWIVPPPREVQDAAAEGISDKKRKEKKKDKGKGKEDGSTIPKTKKKKVKSQFEQPVVLTPVESDTETVEDDEAKAKRKAERLAQLKEDPYYIIDESKPTDDLDSIPVVHLNDMPPLDIGTKEPRLASLRAAATSNHSSQPYEIDRAGEMPAGAATPPFKVTTPPQLSSGTNSHRASPIPLSSFPQYEVPEDTPSSSAPQPIKVVRTKKKATTKKKRTTTVDDG